jgi:tetratricopeptide (TPR) repeat protein
MRRTSMRETEQLTPQEAHHLLTLLQLQVKEGLLATGIYREMGFIYRQVDDFDSALGCFREEIGLSIGKDGIPGSHSAQSFRQMGQIYTERGEDDLAFDALRMALAINPNSFDSLTALGTLVKDPAEALRYLGRAWRIRKGDPTWADVVKTAAARFNRTQQQIEQAVAIVAVQVDLSVRYEFDRASLVRLGIV